MLSVNHLDIRFGEKHLFKDVSVQVYTGNRIGLIGVNGAGKTTLLNILSGLVNQDKGDIYFQGKAINKLRPHQRAAMGIGRTFQGGRVFHESTVLKNVVTGGHVRCSYNLFSTIFKTKKFRCEEASLNQKGLMISKQAELEKDLHSKAGSLAYGQQRKVEIARALSSDPKILLMDEPTAGMSCVDFCKLMDFIRVLVAGGLSVLIVEHNMKLIMDICDQIVVLDFGEKIAEDVPERIRTNEKVISSYLGGPLEGAQARNARD